jgi:hypothetical protein
MNRVSTLILRTGVNVPLSCTSVMVVELVMLRVEIAD